MLDRNALLHALAHILYNILYTFLYKFPIAFLRCRVRGQFLEILRTRTHTQSHTRRNILLFFFLENRYVFIRRRRTGLVDRRNKKPLFSPPRKSIAIKRRDSGGE
jgi:hypothetical protein